MMLLLMPDGEEGNKAQHYGEERGRTTKLRRQLAQLETQKVPPADRLVLSSGSHRPREKELT